MLKIELKFLKTCEQEKYSKKDISQFKEAIKFTKDCFKEEKRLSGNLIIEHNISVGNILADSKLQPEVIVAGIFYNLELKVTKKEIQEKFGKEISELVFGQLQLKDIYKKNKKIESDVLRKIFLATLSDTRILFVKLADKLDNLFTINVFPLKQRKKTAQEILEIYVPLANRLGLELIKRKLEENSFKIVNPKKYKEIKNFLKESKEKRELFLRNFIKEINFLLNKKIKNYKIKGREKSTYSIYKKIINRKVSLDKQKDLFAIRIITDSIENCYNVLGILHKKYKNLQGTLKDYISFPKENGYQSLHTVLKTSENKNVEVQICTNEMNEIAEEGVAAHWSYKKLKSDFSFEKKTAWLRSVLDLKNSQKDKNFLKDLKLNFFEKRFYCYTPKGTPINLPKNSTVLDFAYHIHQEIGNHTIGAKINGIFFGIKKELKSEDVVEIITNKHQKPKRDWIKYVVSPRAKTIIKRKIKKLGGLPISKNYSLKKIEKENFDGLVFSKEFPNHKFTLAKCCSPLPNQKIIGIIKSHKNILVHRKNCEKIKSSENCFPVFWKKEFNKPIKIFVQAEDRLGILADVLNTISRKSFIVKEANAKLIGNNLVECSFVIIPRELENIIKLIKTIQKIKSVKKIYFG